MRILGLALRPDRERPIRIGRVGENELQPFRGRAGILDRQVERFAGPMGLVEGDG